MFQYLLVECRSTVLAVIYNDDTKLCTDVTVLQNMVLTVKKNILQDDTVVSLSVSSI